MRQRLFTSALRALAAGLALVAVGRLVEALSHVPATAAVDMLPIYLGGQALRAGLDPYDPDVLRSLFMDSGARMHVGGFQNYYPPSALALFAPLTALPWRSFVSLLRGVGILALGVGVGLAAIRPRALASAALAVALVLSTRVAFVVLRTGQVSPLVVLACGAGLWALARGKERTAGVAIGLGMAIKLFPALLLPAALVSRRWRAAAIALLITGALWLVAWVLLPTGAHWRGDELLYFLGRPAAPEWHLEDRAALRALWRARFVLGGLASLGALVWAWRTQGRGAALVLLAAGGLGIVGSPHYHEAVLLMPALAAVLGWGPRSGWAWAVGVAMLALGVFGVEGARASAHWLPIAALVLVATGWRLARP